MSVNDVSCSDFSHWELPDVTLSVDEETVDIFGRQPMPVATDIDTESSTQEESVLPPTLSEIEAIQQAAQQAGFEHGQAQGFAEGLEKGRLTGLEQGHKEGFVQGENQGFDAGMEQAQAKIDQFEALLSQFTEPLALLDLDIELQLISLVNQLAKGVIMHELSLPSEHIAYLIRYGLDALPIKKNNVTIRANPQDAKVINQLYQHTEQAKQGWHLEDDPTVTQGGIMMHCEPSELDLSVESRVKAVFSEWEQAQAALALKKQQVQQNTALVNEVNDSDCLESNGVKTDNTETHGSAADRAESQV
ncbi:flagellar assembly protein FliH [uncultured Shewanella sp.]|uniref:flagellar assembly protein FliH n=1 Tax=uncultured Shewanella sp. TaxID=173975 RepID=UPI002627ABF7|nr:flagellar assembly protein FliH [uncultured Shewanella sp.]